MLTSDLAREGIRHSGSFRFADHVYRMEPSGRFGIGYLIDAALLRMPAARSMRNRYLHSRDRIVDEVRRLRAGQHTDIRVVSVPCGIARELVEAATILEKDFNGAPCTLFAGIDADAEPLALSRALSRNDNTFRFIHGDAFDGAIYPSPADVIVSTGFVDFLDDVSAIGFLETCRAALRPGGLLVTSAQRPQRLADYLMRELAELRPVYRDERQIARVVAAAGFVNVATRPDSVGLQTLVTARAPACP